MTNALHTAQASQLEFHEAITSEVLMGFFLHKSPNVVSTKILKLQLILNNMSSTKNQSLNQHENRIYLF